MCFVLQVISNEDQNLTVTSEKTISVEGHEGMLLDGKMFHFNAEEDIDISSTVVTFKSLNYFFILLLFHHVAYHKSSIKWCVLKLSSASDWVMTAHRVATVREKAGKNKTFSRSGNFVKGQGKS